jgi:hypothetical protein
MYLVILLVVFFMSTKIRSLMVSEALRLKVFENRLLSRISGKSDEVRREWHDYMTVS